jgi:hypothetical protein
MDIFRLLGCFAVIPTILLITVSFFVMFTLTKVEKSVLRIFGMVIVGFLWIAALIVFSAGLLLVADGSDYFSDHGLVKTCRCLGSSTTCPGIGMMNYPFHNKIMYKHPGMMVNPHQGMKNPHEGLMMDPHQAINNTQPSSGIKK